MVFGLDHILSEQEAAPEEIAAIREWLSRDGACLLLAPDHDVGFTGDMKQRRVNICIKRQGILPRVLVAASPKLIGRLPLQVGWRRLIPFDGGAEGREKELIAESVVDLKTLQLVLHGILELGKT